MNNNLAMKQYLDNTVKTASNAQLTLMLYNGLVKFLMKAKESIAQNNHQKSHENLIRSQDIISEFQSTLDMKYPIAQNLMLLYDYMKRRLIEANCKKDIVIVDEISSMAVELRDTWAVAMKKSRI